MYQVPTLIDFVSTVSLLSLFAWSYGYVLTVLKWEGLAHFFLGAMFGGVALLQQFSPLEVSPGVLIDMRTVPVLLAAAYLGPLGAFSCLFIAIAARIYSGGVGMEAGVVGLILATLIGLGWRELMQWREDRGVVSLIVLGGLGALRFVALLLLPEETALYVLTNVVPFLVIMEIVSIALLGLLLEREFKIHRGRERQQRLHSYHPSTGLLTADGLDRAYERAVAKLVPEHGVGLLLIQVRHQDWLVRRFGGAMVDDIRATLRGRLVRDLDHTDLVGLTRRNEIAVVVFRKTARDLLGLQRMLRRGLGTERICMSDGAELRISVDIAFSYGEARQPLLQKLQEARVSDGKGDPIVNLPQSVPGRTIDDLFAQAKRSL